MRRLASLAASLLVLALPAAAPAQTPGDEQYTDPFGGQGGGGSQPEPEPEPEEPEPQEPPAAAPQTATSAPEPAPAPVATTAVAAEQQLPRTGADAGLLALGGTLLLASGVALRVRLRLSEPGPRRR